MPTVPKMERYRNKGDGQQGSSPFPSPVLPVHRKQDYFDHGKGMGSDDT